MIASFFVVLPSRSPLSCPCARVSCRPPLVVVWMSLTTLVGWKLKATWSDWKPVLTSLPTQALEATKHGLEVTSAAARSATGKIRRQTTTTQANDATANTKTPAAAAAATSGPGRSSPHVLTSAAAASSSDAISASSTAASVNAAATSSSSWGSKLASGLKESWRANGMKLSREEEKEQRTFLIPATSPKDRLQPHGDATTKSATKAKSLSKPQPTTGGFSFDDDDDNEAGEESAFEPSPRQSRRSSLSQPAASSAGASSSASAASHSTAALSSAVAPRSSSSSSSSQPAPRVARNNSGATSSTNGGRQAAAADHFASLPKLQASGTPAIGPSAGGSSSSSASFPAASAASSSAAHHDPVQKQLHLQADLESQQDLILDDMSHSIARLSNIQHDIGKELAVQKAELDLLDDEMDTAGSHFEMLEKKMQKLLKRSSWSHYKIIFCLVALILFLLFLIIFL